MKEGAKSASRSTCPNLGNPWYLVIELSQDIIIWCFPAYFGGYIGVMFGGEFSNY
jgi:hypothetical protein